MKLKKLLLSIVCIAIASPMHADFPAGQKTYAPVSGNTITIGAYNLTLTSGSGNLGIAAGKTLTVQNTITMSGPDGAQLVLSSGSNTLGTAAYTAASAYAPATSGTAILYANGSGGFSALHIGANLTYASGTLSATSGTGGGGGIPVVSGSGRGTQLWNSTGTLMTIDASGTGYNSSAGLSYDTSGNPYLIGSLTVNNNVSSGGRWPQGLFNNAADYYSGFQVGNAAGLWDLLEMPSGQNNNFGVNLDSTGIFPIMFNTNGWVVINASSLGDTATSALDVRGDIGFTGLINFIDDATTPPTSTIAPAGYLHGKVSGVDAWIPYFQ